MIVRRASNWPDISDGRAMTTGMQPGGAGKAERVGTVSVTQDRAVGFYQRWIVPCLINSAMQNQRLDAYRRQAVEGATGHVLEIEVGSGQNLPLYGSAVDRVYAIDPSLELLRSAGKRGADVRVPVSLLRALAEQLRSPTRSSIPS
jgi:ubiquinone/menaquinone biosynthesis C-methylase UbiE